MFESLVRIDSSDMNVLVERLDIFDALLGSFAHLPLG